MAILVTRLSTAVSSRKTPKMAINHDFPGLRAISANVAIDKGEQQEIPHPMVKSTARFGAPKSSYGHFSHPTGHSRSFQAEKHPKWQKIAISRGYVHFQQMLRETKTKSKKFRIRWSKVFRVLEPLNRVMATLVTRLSTAVSSRKTPKMAINRNFPGLLHPMVKSTSCFGAPKSSYGHFSHPAGHGQAEKHPKWQ